MTGLNKTSSNNRIHGFALLLDLNEILSKLLMDACISPSLMPEGLLREHMMLVAILNSHVGCEVGKYLL